MMTQPINFGLCTLWIVGMMLLCFISIGIRSSRDTGLTNAYVRLLFALCMVLVHEHDLPPELLPMGTGFWICFEVHSFVFSLCCSSKARVESEKEPESKPEKPSLLTQAEARVVTKLHRDLVDGLRGRRFNHLQEQLTKYTKTVNNCKEQHKDVLCAVFDNLQAVVDERDLRLYREYKRKRRYDDDSSSSDDESDDLTRRSDKRRRA